MRLNFRQVVQLCNAQQLKLLLACEALKQTWHTDNNDVQACSAMQCQHTQVINFIVLGMNQA